MITSVKKTIKYVRVFFKWLIIAITVGAVGGTVGALFHLSVDYVTELRQHNKYLLFFLPLGGIAIAGMYRLFSSKGVIDTNRVIESVREETNIPLVMVPLIFISTTITHCFGGSAGREGAALQLGGSIGYNFGKVFRIKKHESHIIVMSGMSAVFSALFGTPLTAAVFSLEVTNVGTFHYTGLFPCIVSSLTASYIAKLFNLNPVQFGGIDFGAFSCGLALKTILLAALCAVVSILFCISLKKFEKLMEKFIKNQFLRAFLGGAIIVLLTVILGTYDYNGAGMDVIGKAMAGESKYEAPLLKIIFTSITVAAGFKGGEIVPTFFIGSTFGCLVAPFVGLSASVGAALGFVALFCGMVNCPIASIFLALEVFGADGIYLFAIASGVSYLLSGSYSLYKSQRILYSKTDDK